MPSFEVKDPSGKVYNVNAPEGATQEDAIAYVRANLKNIPKEDGDFVRGFKSLVPEDKEVLGGLQTLLGVGAKHVLGQGVVSDYLLGAGVKNFKEANEQQEKTAKESDDLEKAYHAGIGTVLTDWLPYQVGSGVANLLETGAFALGGAAVGSILAPGAGTLEGALAPILNKSLIKQGIKNAAKELLETELKNGATKDAAKLAAQTFVENEAKKTLEKEELSKYARSGASTLGSIAGTGAQAVFHGVGEPTSRAMQEAGYDTDKIDFSKLAPAVAVHTLADFAAERVGLNGLSGIGSKSTRNLFLDVGAGMLATGAKEVPPELLQSAAERYGAGLPLADKNAINEYINTAGGAVAMGIVPGGIGGINTRMNAAPVAQPQNAQAVQEEQPAEQAPYAPAFEGDQADRFRNMPGFAGPVNQMGFLNAARDQQAEAAKQAELERKAKINQVMQTQYHADPMMNQMIQNRELAALQPQQVSALQTAVSPAVQTAEQQAPQLGESLTNTPMSQLLGTQNLNSQLLGQRRETDAAQQAAAQSQQKKAVTQINKTVFSSDPIKDRIERNRALQAVGAPPIENTPMQPVPPTAQEAWDAMSPLEQKEAIRKASSKDKWMQKWEDRQKRIEDEHWDQVYGTVPKVTTTKTTPEIKSSEHPENIGITGYDDLHNPITGLVQDGATPFKSREEAAQAKKLQPLMRVLPIGDGFVLTPKTQAQLDAENKNKRNLGKTTAAGEKMGAKSFIASQGGLHPDEKSDMGHKDVPNVKVGGAWLYAGKDNPDRGLRMDQAATALHESGYILDPSDHEDARQAIKENRQKPEHIEESLNQRGEEEYQDYQKGLLLATLNGRPIYEDDLENEPLDSLVRFAKEIGIDTSHMENEAYTRGETQNQAEDMYHQFLTSAVKDYLGNQPETLESRDTSSKPAVSAEEAKIEKELTGKNFIQAAQWAVTNAPNSFARLVAQKVLNRLQAMQKAGVIYNFEVASGNTRTADLRSARGLTNFIWGKEGQPTFISIKLNGATVLQNQAGFPSGMDYTVVLHELLHAATRGQMRFLSSTDPLVKEIRSLHETVINKFNEEIARNKGADLPPVLQNYYKRMNNALSDPDELISWGMTDKGMQKFLSDIKIGNKTIFSHIIGLVRQVLGIAKNFETALDRLVRTTESLIDDSLVPLENGMMKEGYALGKPSTGVMVQQSLFSKKVQHIVDNLQSRRSGFYFDAKTSPLYQRRTAEQAKAVNPEKADDAIRSTKTGQRILDKNIQLKDGQYVGVRLDLNILKSTGVPVQAIHEGKEKTHVGGAGFYNGEVLKYAPSVTLRNVFFKINQPKRERIATGAQTKEPMGSADGQYVDTAPNFDGVEFRFNPKREHLFRDAAGRVLKYADEITTTGNSVFARGNLEYYGEEDVPGRAGNAPTEGVLMQPEGQQAQPTIDTDNRKVSYGQQETLFSQQGLPREETFAMQTMADLAGNTKEKLRASLQNRAPMDRSAFEGMPSSTIEEAESIFHAPNKTIVDRIEENKDHFWKMLAQKTVDQFRAIRDVSERGYMQARLSTATDGMLQGLLFNGHAGLDDGALTVLTEGKNGQKLKGLIETLAPLGREVDRFQQWMALNREALLPDHKRTPLLAKLVSKKDEYLKGDINGRPRAQVYEEVRKDMMALNKSVLDIALEQNLIDKEAYDRFSNDAFYIPFYKVMEDGKIESIRTASRMTNQQFSKMLKGGGEKPFSDLMENTLRNWSHILSASMKNQAALTTIIDASGEGYVTPNLKEGFFWKDGAVHNEKTGKIVGNGDLVQVGKDAEGNREVKSYTTAGRETVKVNIDGYESHFHINDPFLFESLSAVTYLGPQSKVLDMMRGFKNLLRFGVTLSPAFKASNLIKDSIQAAGLSGLDNNFVKNVMDGWASSKPGSPVYIAALAGGGVFNYGTTLEGNRSEVIKKLLARGVNGENIIDTKEKAKYWLAKIWHNYEDIGNRSENINRIALYEKMRNEGYSHLEASYHARDLMDFSMQGSSGAIRYLSQIVPFLNARLQGLYKLGRDGVNPTVRVFYNAATGKEISQNDAQKAKSFMTVATAISLASMALYLAFKDDDDFKKREQWDRDFFWWFKIPGTDEVIRIPKPFEFGSIGTLAERSLEQIVDKDVEGKRFGESIGRMVFQTFSLDPTPQFFKPLIDVYANKDSFTNAPIETAGMERLSKQERMTNETSALAKGLGGVSKALGAVTGGAAEMSPVQIDYMIKSYMGWMGGTIATASQYAMMPFNDGVYADADWQKRMSLGFVQKLPSVQSTYVTDFYQNNQAISQAYADMRHYAEIGDSAKVQEILEEKGDKIRLAKMYDAASKNMANVRKQLNHIQDPNNTSLNGEQKREEVLRLKGLISDIAYRAESIRLSMRK